MDPVDALGPDLGALVEWHSTDEVLMGPLADLLRAGQWNINKIAHYLPVYESVFGPKRNLPVLMLEIGVSFGGSLKLWHDYFSHPDTKIIGIDYNPNCAQFDDPDNNVFVRIGQQQDPEFLRSLSDEFGGFDFILDDGSHIPSFTLASFQHLFPNALHDGGAYLVEDLHTCYSADCPPPELDDNTPQFTEVIGHLIDAMHQVYTQTPTGEEFSNAFEPDNEGRRSRWVVPLATRIIQSIEINDSIAVIRKGIRPVPRMIRRWSRETMASVLNEDATHFLDEHPHLDQADQNRQDWIK